MKFFVETADVAEIKELVAIGMLDGVTTNAALVAKTGRDRKTIIAEIAAVVSGPVLADVEAIDGAGMIADGRRLGRIAKNIMVKLPLTRDGLKACKVLTAKGVKTTLTLCFTSNQALLAAKVGATFVSPFIGRIDEVGYDGVGLVREIKNIYGNYYPELETSILAASIRTVGHLRDAALVGADAATVPPAVLMALFAHPLTEKCLAQGISDWKETEPSLV